MRTTWMLALVAVAACARETDDRAVTDTSAAIAADDPDVPVAGAAGLPAGYQGRTDGDRESLGEVRYTQSGRGWEVQTGPAHIMYAPRDTAQGVFAATATFEQLEAPSHPEAYGIFVGGQHLEHPTRQYTYFLVRGTGEYMVRVREGERTRNVIGWTAHDAVPRADEQGRARYTLAVRVGRDSVRFLVNDTQVAASPVGSVSTDGVAGLRINHNLRVRVEPVAIQRAS